MSERRFRNVYARFAGGCPPCTFANLGTLASGYVQAIGAWDVPPPVLAANDPAIGGFVYGGTSGTDPLEQPGYIPPETPDSRIGVLTIGVSPVGWTRPFHGTLTPSGTLSTPSTETPWPEPGDDGITGTVTLISGTDEIGFG